MMALAFSNLSPEHCFSYMDDLIVIGFSDSNHISNLRKVFETCRKCQFFKNKVSFLGHICTDEGLKPDPAKIVLDKYKKSVCGITVVAYLAHRKIFEIKLAKEGVNLKTLFANLQKAASVHKFKFMQISIKAGLFSMCTIDEFKQYGNIELKNIKIELIKLLKIVTDDNEKFNILKSFHDDKLFGGRTGQKKMYAKLIALLLA